MRIQMLSWLFSSLNTRIKFDDNQLPETPRGPQPVSDTFPCFILTKSLLSIAHSVS